MGWRVEQPQTAMQLLALRRCVNLGSPFGSRRQHRTIESLGLASTFRPRGRPRKPNQ